MTVRSGAVTTENPTGLAELVAAAGVGDAAAWRELVRRHAGLVWSVARMYRLSDADAADVTQTTWLRLAEHLGRLREPARLPAWLATTARRESLRLIAARRRESPGELPDRAGEEESGPEGHTVRRDRDARLWREFETLPERCRRLLRLLAGAPELSYADVGSLLGMPVGSIGPTRGRCLATLRSRLEGVLTP